MASLPPAPILPGPETLSDPGTAEARWESLHGQAAQLAALGRIAPEAPQAGFAALFAAAGDRQRQLAAQGLEDIAAMLQPGLAALATLTARGQDTAAPALALWREFHAARASVLAVLQVAAVD